MEEAKVKNYFPQGVSEKQFFSDLERGKRIVDNGIKDFFIVNDPECFKHVEAVGKTLLKDCVDIFGESYVKLFRFADVFKTSDGNNDAQRTMSYSIRPITKSDKRWLRCKYVFFPKGTWVADWRDGEGCRMLLPFIQRDDASVVWLGLNKVCCKDTWSKETNDSLPPVAFLEKLIERLPDYYDCQIAIVNYKGVDILIPIAGKTAKYTFKNREKDEFGVKRRLVHSVKEFERATGSVVERHARGRSDFDISGEHVILSTPFEFNYNMKQKLKDLKNASKGKITFRE